MTKFNETYNILMEAFTKITVYGSGRSDRESVLPNNAKTLDAAKALATKKEHNVVYAKLGNGKWEAIAKFDDKNNKWMGGDFNPYKQLRGLLKHTRNDRTYRTVLKDYIKLYGLEYKLVDIKQDELNKLESNFNKNNYTKYEDYETPKFRSAVKLVSDKLNTTIYIIQYTMGYEIENGPDVKKRGITAEYIIEIVTNYNDIGKEIVDLDKVGLDNKSQDLNSLKYMFSSINADNFTNAIKHFNEDDLEDNY